jgi:hypothetical protein
MEGKRTILLYTVKVATGPASDLFIMPLPKIAASLWVPQDQ